MFYLAPLLPVAAVAGFTKLYLMGKSHAEYDRDTPVTFEVDPESDGVKAVEAYLIENFVKPAMMASSTGDKLAAKRKRFEEGTARREFPAKFREDEFEVGDITVKGEWTLVKGADPNRRILYLHGGAFTVGSPVSHRHIIFNLAKRTGCAVFAPDYRLMPENPRMASIDDARASYKWILENGPDGPAPVEKLVVAGDSAGGNLALMLSNWARDTGLRMANAVVGISPVTDSTAESPSIKANIDTDTMLRPLIAPMLKIPRALLVWGAWKAAKISPASPLVSPLRADLSNLPPTLIHVSSAEALYDDARRYAAKAKDAGSPVKLQSWSNVCHVWHAFDTLLPESPQAFDEIAKFLESEGIVKTKPKAKSKSKAKTEPKAKPTTRGKATKSAKPKA